MRKLSIIFISFLLLVVNISCHQKNNQHFENKHVAHSDTNTISILSNLPTNISLIDSTNLTNRDYVFHYFIDDCCIVSNMNGVFTIDNLHLYRIKDTLVAMNAANIHGINYTKSNSLDILFFDQDRMVLKSYPDIPNIQSKLIANYNFPAKDYLDILYFDRNEIVQVEKYKHLIKRSGQHIDTILSVNNAINNLNYKYTYAYVNYKIDKTTRIFGFGVLDGDYYNKIEYFIFDAINSKCRNITSFVKRPTEYICDLHFEPVVNNPNFLYVNRYFYNGVYPDYKSSVFYCGAIVADITDSSSWFNTPVISKKSTTNICSFYKSGKKNGQVIGLKKDSTTYFLNFYFSEVFYRNFAHILNNGIIDSLSISDLTNDEISLLFKSVFAKHNYDFNTDRNANFFFSCFKFYNDKIEKTDNLIKITGSLTVNDRKNLQLLAQKIFSSEIRSPRAN